MIVAHIVNNIGKWGAGFSGAVGRKWPTAAKVYSRWADGEIAIKPFELGKTLFVPVSRYVFVAHMCAQQGVGRATVPIRYDSLDLCVEHVREAAFKLNAQVVMPRIGCGLAGGSWHMVEAIIQKNMAQTEVYVYDLS